MDAEASPAARSTSTRSRSASTASRCRSSAWRAARTSSRPSRSRCRSPRVFEHQKDKPGAIAVMAAAAQESARARRAAAGAARSARGAAARERRDDRPLRERGGRAFDRALAHRGRDGGVQARAWSTSPTTSRACARSCARSRSPPKAQMQSTIKLKEEHGEHFDPLEFDRFSRMQELTRFLAESPGRRDHAAPGRCRRTSTRPSSRSTRRRASTASCSRA